MQRIKELDFLKGVLILLVISFHLVYFEQLHPDIKQVVYTFHMPGFLLISGYLMNISKEPKDFLRTLLWLSVPYLVMESGYIYMASLLPINEHIPILTPAVFLDKLFLHPLGPYWYLHALILCGGLYYSVFRYMSGRATARPYILLVIAYYVISRLGILTFSSSLYFLAGAVLRQSGKDFLLFFLPTRLSVVAFALLACFTKFPTQASLNGALIVYFAISTLLWLYPLLPFKGRMGGVFLGRNSLPLYVFSPIFTVLCKQIVPYLKFDPTGLSPLFVVWEEAS